MKPSVRSPRTVSGCRQTCPGKTVFFGNWPRLRKRPRSATRWRPARLAWMEFRFEVLKTDPTGARLGASDDAARHHRYCSSIHAGGNQLKTGEGGLTQQGARRTRRSDSARQHLSSLSSSRSRADLRQLGALRIDPRPGLARVLTDSVRFSGIQSPPISAKSPMKVWFSGRT